MALAWAESPISHLVSSPFVRNKFRNRSLWSTSTCLLDNLSDNLFNLDWILFRKIWSSNKMSYFMEMIVVRGFLHILEDYNKKYQLWFFPFIPIGQSLFLNRKIFEHYCPLEQFHNRWIDFVFNSIFIYLLNTSVQLFGDYNFQLNITTNVNWHFSTFL